MLSLEIPFNLNMVVMRHHEVNYHQKGAPSVPDLVGIGIERTETWEDLEKREQWRGVAELYMALHCVYAHSLLSHSVP